MQLLINIIGLSIYIIGIYCNNIFNDKEEELTTRDFCSSETVDVSCYKNQASGRKRGSYSRHKGQNGHVTSSNHVIIIHKAGYGRMHARGRCISGTYTLGCELDVTQTLKLKCDGRKKCNPLLVATLDTLENSKTLNKRNCPKDLKSFLSVSYRCVKVSSLDECSEPTKLINDTMLTSKTTGSSSILNTSGYISTSVAGNKEQVVCCKEITVEKGKRLELRLLRYANLAMGERSKVHRVSRSCDTLDVIDNEVKNVVSLCRDNDLFFSSVSNRIKLCRITGSKSKLIHYKAIGCADIEPPRHAMVRRYGAEAASINCENSRETWYLTCRLGRWVGLPTTNCTSTAVEHSDLKVSDLYKSTSSTTFSQGILLAISVGAMLGALIGACLLFTVCVLQKRYTVTQHHTPRSNGGIQGPGMGVGIGAGIGADTYAATPTIDYRESTVKSMRRQLHIGNSCQDDYYVTREGLLQQESETEPEVENNWYTCRGKDGHNAHYFCEGSKQYVPVVQCSKHDNLTYSRRGTVDMDLGQRSNVPTNDSELLNCRFSNQL